MSEVVSGRGATERGDAERLAIRIFELIVADVDRIIQLMNVTGLQPETLRSSANTPHFLLGILDYVSRDDELLKAIHSDLGIPPVTVLAAAGHLAPTPEPAALTEKKQESRSQLPRRSLFR